MIVKVWVLPPPVPVTVKVLVPVGAPPRTVTTIVDVPEPGAAIEEGLKLTVTSLSALQTPIRRWRNRSHSRRWS